MQEELSVRSGSDFRKTVNYKRAGREMATQFLYQFDLAGSELNPKELDIFWRNIELSAPEELIDKEYFKSREYAERIINGVIENQQKIDQAIRDSSPKWDIPRMGVIDRNIIRVAVYEMFYCDDIPPLVSINEAIEISKDFAEDRSGAFINGVLNGIKNSLNRQGREEDKH